MCLRVVELQLGYCGGWEDSDKDGFLRPDEHAGGVTGRTGARRHFIKINHV